MKQSLSCSGSVRVFALAGTALYAALDRLVTPMSFVDRWRSLPPSAAPRYGRKRRKARSQRNRGPQLRSLAEEIATTTRSQRRARNRRDHPGK